MIIKEFKNILIILNYISIIIKVFRNTECFKMKFLYSNIEIEDVFDILMIEQQYFHETCSFKYEMLSTICNQKLSFKCILDCQNTNTINMKSNANANNLVQNKVIAGFIKVDLKADIGEASIDVLCVLPEYRRLGIAKKLIKLAVTAICKSYSIVNNKKCASENHSMHLMHNDMSKSGNAKIIGQHSKPIISLLVNVDNVNAINLYKSLGFVIKNEIPDVYCKGDSAYTMILSENSSLLAAIIL